MKKLVAALFALLLAIGLASVITSSTATAGSDCDYSPVNTSKAVIWHAGCDLGDNREIPIRCMANTPASDLWLEMYDSHMVGLSPYGEEGSAFLWADHLNRYENCDGWGDADGVAQVWVRTDQDIVCLNDAGTAWVVKWSIQGWNTVVNHGKVYFCRVVTD